MALLLGRARARLRLLDSLRAGFGLDWDSGLSPDRWQALGYEQSLVAARTALKIIVDPFLAAHLADLGHRKPSDH
jgi:hypothetical protein